MSLILDAGEVSFSDSVGAIKWSSSDKNLKLLSFVSGSFVVNTKNPSGGSIIQTETTNLGAVPATASVIIGQYIVGSNTYAIGGDRVYRTNGALMINANAYETWPTGIAMLASAVWYRLDITGGNLIATVNYRLPQLATAITGATVQVRALIGGFEF